MTNTGEPPGVDLGHGHTLRWVGWYPDRELNPHRVHLPDVEKYAAVIEHPRIAPGYLTRSDGTTCVSVATFAGDVQREIEPDRPVWTVEQWEPLTLSPSLLCTDCGDHGFVRGGRWEPA